VHNGKIQTEFLTADCADDSDEESILFLLSPIRDIRVIRGRPSPDSEKYGPEILTADDTDDSDEESEYLIFPYPCNPRNPRSPLSGFSANGGEIEHAATLTAPGSHGQNLTADDADNSDTE